MSEFVVETKDLTKAYDDTVVVDKLNLRVEEGELFGFLGPNGAGKTTTILMLLGLTEPTSGTASVCGYNSTREPLKVKRISGYVPEKVGFYEELAASYNLLYTARLNGLSDEVAEKKLGEALEIVGLSKVAGQNVKTFSRGMKQRLAIADLLVKTPKLAFLDEPTSGIDPEGVNQTLDLIAKIAREQRMTVILSSHQLNHVQRICNRVGIMVKGQIVVDGLIGQLGQKAFGGAQYSIEVKLVEFTADIIDCLQKVKGVLGVERSGDLLRVNCEKDLRPQIAKAVVDCGGSLIEIKVRSYALEDIYMKYFTEA